MSSLYLLRQLDLRQVAGLNEKKCKQSARRPRSGQDNYQRHRQESDDLKTKGSIQISYFGRQNGSNEVVGGRFRVRGSFGNFHYVVICVGSCLVSYPAGEFALP